jgi:MFS superfamily sulfate permease-like transporter
MSDKHSLTPATKKEIESARATGQVIGFAQGVGAALLVGVALKFLGWIPFLVVGGAVVYVGYKLLFRRKGKGKEEKEEKE